MTLLFQCRYRKDQPYVKGVNIYFLIERKIYQHIFGGIEINEKTLYAADFLKHRNFYTFLNVF